MKVKATSKFVGTSSRKIGLVAGLIRGQAVTDAQVVLANTNKRATEPVGKALNSALANAQNNQNLKRGDLIVEAVLIGPGPTLKRFRPRARGAAGSIKKRTSHITVILSDMKPDKEVMPKASVATQKPATPDEPKTEQKPKSTAKKATKAEAEKK